MEQLDYLINIVVGGAMVPALEALKRKYPGMQPISKVAISFAGIFAATYLLANYAFNLNFTLDQVIDFSAKSQVFAQVWHAAYNTVPPWKKATAETNATTTQ